MHNSALSQGVLTVVVLLDLVDSRMTQDAMHGRSLRVDVVSLNAAITACGGTLVSLKCRSGVVHILESFMKNQLHATFRGVLCRETRH